MTWCFQCPTDLEALQDKAAIKYIVYQGRSKHDVHHVISGFLVRRWCFVNLIKQVKTTECKFSEMYRSVFKLPSIRTRDVTIEYLMAAYSSTTDARLLWQYRMQKGDERSFRSLQTLAMR